MDEIFAEFHAMHGGPPLDQIKSGSTAQEVVWALAKSSAIMIKEGWGKSAIGRFFNRDHSTIVFHNKATQ